MIRGNEQDNFIDGLAGNDTYIYTIGGGIDTFNFKDISSATNVLRIEGHDASQMYGKQFGNSVLLGFKNNTDKIWLFDYALNDYYDNESNQISYKFDKIIFDSGEIWTTTNVDALVTRAENNQAPVIQYYPSTLNVKIDEVLQYTFEDNMISDPDQDDQLSFKLTLQTKDSNGEYQDIPDWITFDPQTLSITASPQDDVDIGQLNFYLWATDLYGIGTGVGVNINIQPSANTPIAGAIYDTLGNDSLIGGTEDNIFFYIGGKDTLQDAGGIDILRFGNGITFNQVGSGLMKAGNDLILKVNGSNSNQITLKSYFLAGDNLIETIDFETGGELTAEQIFGAFGLTIPTTTPPTEPETGSDDPIGDSIYNYTTGVLIITEQSGNDKVVFKNGITFSQVGSYLNKSGDDLILKVDGSNTNKVTVKNFFLGGQYLVETFHFDTGGQLSAEQIFGAFGLTIPTTSEPEIPIEPGTSNVPGNTTYDYTIGALTITEQLGNDKVLFKNGITFGQIGNYLTKSEDDLILKVNGSNTNKVTIKNFFLGGAFEVESFIFETGGQITSSQIYGAFGLQRPLNAEDYTDNNVVLGEHHQIDTVVSQADLSEIFSLGDGADVVELTKLSSGNVELDYWTDFDVSEDKIDISSLIDEVLSSSNVNQFVQINYDNSLKTNTISIKQTSKGSHVDSLVLTNQSEQLLLQDLLNNQSLLY